MLVSCSVTYSFGNLNTYVISYLRDRVDKDIDYADWIYVTEVTIFLIFLLNYRFCFQTSTMIGGALAPVGGQLAKRRIGLRPCLALGCLIQRYIIFPFNGDVLF